MLNRHLLPLCCILLACAVLAGCSAPAGETPPVAASASQAQTGQDTEQAQDKQLRFLSRYAQSATQEGYYYIEGRTDAGANLRYLDFATQESLVLCNRLECTHNSDTCAGWLDSLYNTPEIICLADKLVLVYPGNPLNYEMDPKTLFAHIDVMDLNGGNCKTIASYASHLMISNFFATDETSLYYQLDVYDLAENTEKTARLEALQLESGDITVIGEIASDKVFLMGAAAQSFYLKQIVPDPNETDVRRAFETQQHQIASLPLSGGAGETVFSWQQGALRELFVEGKLVSIASDFALNSINLQSGAQEQLLPPETIEAFVRPYGENVSAAPIALHDDFLLCKASAIGETPAQSKNAFFVVDLQSKQLSPVDAATKRGTDALPLEIRAITKDYIVSVAEYTLLEGSFVAQDGTVYPVSWEQPRLVLTKTSAFFTAEK